MFKGPETFVIGNVSIKRCNIHSQISLFWPGKLKSGKISSACWLSFLYDDKVLTIGAIILSK